MKNKITIQSLRTLDLKALNEILADIFRELNRIADSADEVSFRKTKNNTKELLINDGTVKNVFKKKDLKLENVTNESKATMFTNPKFTSGQSGSWNNSDTNRMQFWGGANNNVYLEVHNVLNECAIGFFNGLNGRWHAGMDVDDAVTKFKINYNTVPTDGQRLADPSNFELDNNGNLELTGDLSVNGGDATVTGGESGNATLTLQADESDDNGDDWKIINAALTNVLTIGNDISGSNVPYITITPHATVANGTTLIYSLLKLNTETAAASATGKIAVLDSGILKYRTPAELTTELGFRDVKIHQFYTTDANQDYMPFGASTAESDSTASSLDDDTLFIAPYDGILEKIVLQSETDVSLDAGDTTIALRVNGTTGTGVTETVSDDSTATFTWSSANTFSAGNRIRLSIDPTGTLKYVTATSVWKYTV